MQEGARQSIGGGWEQMAWRHAAARAPLGRRIRVAGRVSGAGTAIRGGWRASLSLANAIRPHRAPPEAHPVTAEAVCTEFAEGSSGGSLLPKKVTKSRCCALYCQNRSNAGWCL